MPSISDSVVGLRHNSFSMREHAIHERYEMDSATMSCFYLLSYVQPMWIRIRLSELTALIRSEMVRDLHIRLHATILMRSGFMRLPCVWMYYSPSLQTKSNH